MSVSSTWSDELPLEGPHSRDRGVGSAAAGIGQRGMKDSFGVEEALAKTGLTGHGMFAHRLLASFDELLVAGHLAIGAHQPNLRFQTQRRRWCRHGLPLVRRRRRRLQASKRDMEGGHRRLTRQARRYLHSRRARDMQQQDRSDFPADDLDTQIVHAAMGAIHDPRDLGRIRRQAVVRCHVVCSRGDVFAIPAACRSRTLGKQRRTTTGGSS